MFDGFFDGNPFLHPEHAGGARGVRPMLIEDVPWHEDWFVIALMVLTILTIFSAYYSWSTLKEEGQRLLFGTLGNDRTSAAEGGFETTHTLFHTLLLCLTGGLACLWHYIEVQHITLWHVSGLEAWLLLSTGWLSYFVLKAVAQEFVNWIFFDRTGRSEWRRTQSFAISAEALTIFPVVIISVGLCHSAKLLAAALILPVVVGKAILCIRAKQIFFPKKYGYLHLFAYLCTLEAAPLYFTVRLYAKITQYLIVNF